MFSTLRLVTAISSIFWSVLPTLIWFSMYWRSCDWCHRSQFIRFLKQIKVPLQNCILESNPNFLQSNEGTNENVECAVSQDNDKVAVVKVIGLGLIIVLRGHILNILLVVKISFNVASKRTASRMQRVNQYFWDDNVFGSRIRVETQVPDAHGNVDQSNEKVHSFPAPWSIPMSDIHDTNYLQKMFEDYCQIRSVMSKLKIWKFHTQKLWQSFQR